MSKTPGQVAYAAERLLQLYDSVGFTCDNGVHHNGISEGGQWLSGAIDDLRAALQEEAAAHAVAEQQVARITELDQAIGVMVPTILRCFIAHAESETDRDVDQRVLARVDKAMESREPHDPLYGTIAEAS